MYMANSNRTLIIIPCGKRKIWDKDPSVGKTPAREAYISNYFKLCMQYAEKFSDEWIILSGKYGIINPDFILNDNYNTRLKATREFRNKIKEQLKILTSKGFTSFVSLCGKDYSQLLEDTLNSFCLNLITPLKGLRIGMRQKVIKERLDNDTPL